MARRPTHTIGRAVLRLPWTYLIYPAAVCLGIVLYVGLVSARVDPAGAGFLAIVAGTLPILLFEHALPYRPAWRPRHSDLREDVLYMALIQIGLPRLLALGIALGLAEEVGADAPWADVWPRDWPLAMQAVLLVITADFMRYWLHRLAHAVPHLWRLHAVHHSPDRLYWLNTSRFHPFEKTLQFSLDFLPFILMGVDPRVLGVWFVAYSINGFFQHSNIRLSFGFLSQVFSTAEMHRWHHSCTPAESNSNYANIFILWDRLFGTYYRPLKREVDALGLLNRDYPTGLFQQLQAPFLADLDRRAAYVPSLRQWLLNANLRVHMFMISVAGWCELRRAARTPAVAQEACLGKILRANADTEYGQRFGFADITSYEAYASRVPIVTYEDLRPYVDRQLETGAPALTHAQPVTYNKTSGTTGVPKFLPVVAYEVRNQQRHAALMSFLNYRCDPGAFAGKLWVLAAPVEEGRMKSGTPFGSASGLLYAATPSYIARKYVLPPEIFGIEDHELRYHLILRLALAEKNITFLGAPNPTTFLRLASLFNEKPAEWVESIRTGTFSRWSELPGGVQSALKGRLAPNPERANELVSLFGGSGSVAYRDLWPFLRTVSTWTGGNCAIVLAKAKKLFNPTTRFVELGYLSSEMRGTLTIDCVNGAGLPAIRDYVFEFIEPERWERGERNLTPIDRLVIGRHYYIVVTTPSGLYRYFMNDIVQVEGYFGQTPTLRFVQKGTGVTNITGEKLYENQVAEALQIVAHGGLEPAFFLMLAHVEDAYYELLLEGVDCTGSDLARRVDRMLGELNVEYREKRESGRLGTLRVTTLPAGTGEAYRSHCLRAGQKDGQFKMVSLQYAHQCAFPFAAAGAAA